jgi:hypothetical protein
VLRRRTILNDEPPKAQQGEHLRGNRSRVVEIENLSVLDDFGTQPPPEDQNAAFHPSSSVTTTANDGSNIQSDLWAASFGSTASTTLLEVPIRTENHSSERQAYNGSSFTTGVSPTWTNYAERKAMLQLRLYIITRGGQESTDLAKKIESKLKKSKHKRCPNLENGVLTVAADTGAQIAKLCRETRKEREGSPKCKFVVIADECDAYYRTPKGRQWKSYNDLMDMKPCLRLEISATPIPALLVLIHQKKLKVEMMTIGTRSKDYSGVEEMSLFCEAGENVFLPSKLRDCMWGKEYIWESPCLNDELDTKQLFGDEYNTFDFEEPFMFPLF